MVGKILTKTSSNNHATKLFKVNGQYYGLSFLSTSKTSVKCLFDLPFLPPFKLPTWKMYSLVGPFHELVAVVGPWAMISDELVPLLACSLMQSCSLLRLGQHVPHANLHPTHSIQHVVQSHFGDTNLIKGYTMAKLCSSAERKHCCVNFRGDVHQVISSLWIDLCSKICHQV